MGKKIELTEEQKKKVERVARFLAEKPRSVSAVASKLSVTKTAARNYVLWLIDSKLYPKLKTGEARQGKRGPLSTVYFIGDKLPAEPKAPAKAPKKAAAKPAPKAKAKTAKKADKAPKKVAKAQVRTAAPITPPTDAMDNPGLLESADGGFTPEPDETPELDGNLSMPPEQETRPADGLAD